MVGPGLKQKSKGDRLVAGQSKGRGVKRKSSSAGVPHQGTVVEVSAAQ